MFGKLGHLASPPVSKTDMGDVVIHYEFNSHAFREFSLLQR